METDTKAMVVAMGTIPVIVTVATFSLAYPVETAATVGTVALLGLYVWWHMGTFRCIAESAHVPTVPTVADPLIWTREGLIDFFQLNDSMSAETFHKFEAIITDTAAAVVPKPRIRVKAAVVPTVAHKPRVRVKAGSRHINATAENTAVQAPEPEKATCLAESTHTHTTAAHTAAHSRYAARWVQEHAIGLLPVSIIAFIGLSNTMAGFCFRAVFTLIPMWAGWVEMETALAFSNSYLFKLI